MAGRWTPISDRGSEAFEDIDIDVSECLVWNTIAQFDSLTVQATEILLASLVRVCSWMLADHLQHGRYSEVTQELEEELPKTNVSSERDFGMFDRLLGEKARASAITVEGMILFKQNRLSV